MSHSHLTAALALAAGLLLAPAAHAEVDYYVAFGAGGSIHEQVDIENNNTSETFETTPFPGYMITGALGVDLGLVRLEGEILYNLYDLDDLESAGVESSADGSFATLAGMANAFVDFPLPFGPTPFIGAGVGYGEVSANNIEFGGTDLLDDSDTGLIYQARAGIAFGILPLTDLVLGYRYLVADGIELSDGGVELDDDQLESHIFELGLRISF